VPVEALREPERPPANEREVALQIAPRVRLDGKCPARAADDVVDAAERDRDVVPDEVAVLER